MSETIMKKLKFFYMTAHRNVVHGGAVYARVRAHKQKYSQRIGLNTYSMKIFITIA